jgi:DNA-binding NtrC family response regulator
VTEESTRILLLEDDPIIALLTTELLGSFGFPNCTHAFTVQEALAHLEAEPVDLCIFDMRLRRGTCAEALEDASRRGLPIILTSGYSDQGVLPSVPDGCEFLQKPVPAQLLRDTVLRMVGLQEQTRSTGGTG